MSYLLDANIFVAAARTYYHPELVPSFWGWLEGEVEAGHVHSIVNVREEIEGGGDGDFLKRWADPLPDSFWLDPHADAQEEIKQVTRWVTRRDLDYKEAARAKFLTGADSFLVAMALAEGHVVVTDEVSEPNSKKNIKIPDACTAHGVGYKNPLDLYRQLGMRF